MTKKINKTWDLEKLNARIPGLMLSQRQIIVSLLSQARKEGIEEIIEIIKSKSPSLVCPSDLPPFREDYINKWNLIDELKKKGKE